MHNSIISVILFVGLLYGPIANATNVELHSNVPDRYVVVPGDTLWSLSSRFLKDPWRWKEIWGLNEQQIKNPHKIFPGDLIVIERTPEGNKLRIIKETVVMERLSPHVRMEMSDAVAIPSIPVAAIEPFLSQPLVVDKDSLESAPIVLGTSDNRVLLSKGDQIYAKDMPTDQGSSWQIFRPGKALIDPSTPDEETLIPEWLGEYLVPESFGDYVGEGWFGEDKGKILGYEAIYLGDAEVERFADVSTISIVRSTQEIFKGDRLIPAPPTEFINYAPYAPEQDVNGRIISVYGGVTEIGKGSIVVLSKGAQDGLETGNVLAVNRRHLSETGDDSLKVDRVFDEFGATSKRQVVELPEERAGLVFVFRVFEKVSYALVMQTTQPIRIFDSVKTP
jgi:hypothetical protein